MLRVARLDIDNRTCVRGLSNVGGVGFGEGPRSGLGKTVEVWVPGVPGM